MGGKRQSDDWISARAKAAGPPDFEVRYEAAGRVLGEARRRNRGQQQGGCGCPILVEGRRDREALEIYGFTGPIELVNRGWDRSRMTAYLFEKYGVRNPVDNEASLILLFDWDRTGGQLTHDFNRRMVAFGMKLDTETRLIIARALKPEGRTVEGLAPHAHRLRAFIDTFDEDGAEESDFNLV